MGNFLTLRWRRCWANRTL